VFFSVQDARQFADLFLDSNTRLRLLGIALHTDSVDEFLSNQRPGPDQGEPGIYSSVGRRSALEPGASELGWEILCYDHGGFHSWLCNGLEKEVARMCGIRPGPAGFVVEADDAATAAEYCGREEVGAEPGFWAPWLITEYSVRATGA
jgi:hypothetical protein